MPAQAIYRNDTVDLISGDALKESALRFLTEIQVKVEQEQSGLLSVFDSWFTRVLGQLSSLDASRPWEESVGEATAHSPSGGRDLQWDLLRLKLFLDRWQQGRFVGYLRREQSGAHYHPRFGTEFGPDVLLTCQGAPSLMRWRGRPLMKNVFDFAMYPALLAELRPRSVFEVGAGKGASAAWFADLLALGGVSGQVHSVDIAHVELQHPSVTFYKGDCTNPETLFPMDILQAAPHPWLVVEDAHHNVSGVLDLFHRFMVPGDYLVVEDSDVKRDAIRAFVTAHPEEYVVDTQFTDNFGRNATCAADSIFRKIGKTESQSLSSCSGRSVTQTGAVEVAIPLGDPVPWFGAPLLGGGTFNLQVAAGRWIILAFLPAAQLDSLGSELGELIRDLPFDDDHVIFCGVLPMPPRDPEQLIKRSSKSVQFVTDYDGTIGRLFGAFESPRTFALDPMLRAIANVPWDEGAAHARAVRDVVKSLPHVDNSAGVPLRAPVLIVPRVLDFPLCETLVRAFDELGGDESGFLLDVEGKTAAVVDHRLKRRRDLTIVHPVLREAMRSQVVRRLLPAIDRFFQFKATRLDRYIVSCYDSGGHFYRHRDNENIGAQHRRFAVTVNLNKDYEGGDLMFPEFGRRTYRAPVGGAMVFSCGALHQVTPVMAGRRYAFLGFLYGEADAALREANNAKLHPEAARYVTDSDLLFPGRQ